jgi:hypothetical protein
MSLIVKNESIEREKPMLGMHDAICCFVEDIGTHIAKTQWGNKAKHKIVILWEIDENMKGIYDQKYMGRPFMISKQYTFTLFEKGNLSHDLESWFSRKMSDETRKNGFDLHSLIGKKCQINLIESEDGKYINIGGVLPASKTNILKPVCVELPAWITKKRSESIEASQQPRQLGNDPSEPLPDEPLPDDYTNPNDGCPF